MIPSLSPPCSQPSIMGASMLLQAGPNMSVDYVICYKNEHLTQLSQSESLTGIEYTDAETMGLLIEAHVS